MSLYEYFVVLVYLINTILLFMYGFHYYLIAYLYYKKKESTKGQEKPLFDRESILQSKLPFVTVQIPIYNELYVSKRIVDAVMEFNYPKDLFEVQVLDDSTDETKDILTTLVDEYKKKGFLIDHIQRKIRTDHKAGALREGLSLSRGEYIAIFDCDFVPPKDFLLSTIPHFKTSNKLGLIQTRWGHLNRDYSSLTRAQSLGVDGHFLLEQATRSDYGLWLNFNGTAGVWSKACIIDAGNWHGDTLTEDLDLSYRAQMKGWEFKFLSDVVCDAELPVDISAYKGQQFRWAKGSLQTAIKLMRKVLKARYPLRKRMEAMVHLTYYLVHPLMVFNLLWMFPLLEIQNKYFRDFVINGYPIMVFVGMFFMIVGTLAPSFFFIYTQKELTGSWTKRLTWLPYLLIYGIGIAVHISKAFIEAVMGKKSSFIRTPKYSIGAKQDNWLKKRYSIPISFVVVFEIIFGVYALVVAYYAILYDVYLSALFPLMFAFSFFYVALLSILQATRRSIFYKQKVKIASLSEKM